MWNVTDETPANSQRFLGKVRRKYTRIALTFLYAVWHGDVPAV